MKTLLSAFINPPSGLSGILGSSVISHASTTSSSSLSPLLKQHESNILKHDDLVEELSLRVIVGSERGEVSSSLKFIEPLRSGVMISCSSFLFFFFFLDKLDERERRFMSVLITISFNFPSVRSYSLHLIAIITDSEGTPLEWDFIKADTNNKSLTNVKPTCSLDKFKRTSIEGDEQRTPEVGGHVKSESERRTV